MNPVFLIPGIAGSLLDGQYSVSVPLAGNVNLPTVTLWITKKAALLHYYKVLNIDSNGNDNPLAGSVEPSGLWQPVYGKMLNAIAKQFITLQAAWDWRRSVVEVAPRVLQAIDAITGGGDFSIVAHSAGGRLARFIWKILKLQGKEHRMKKLICIGTPHLGSWSTVRMLFGLNDIYQQLREAGLYINYLLPSAVVAYRTMRNSHVTEIDELIESWPGVYELLPSPRMIARDAFSIRALYQKQTYPKLPAIPQKLLDGASTTDMVLNDIDTIPPPTVFHDIVGLGIRTPSWVAGPTRALDGTDQYNWTNDGDGRVHAADAHIAANVWYVGGEHSDMLDDPAVQKLVIDILKEQATIAGPVPQNPLLIPGITIPRPLPRPTRIPPNPGPYMMGPYGPATPGTPPPVYPVTCPQRTPSPAPSPLGPLPQLTIGQ